MVSSSAGVYTLAGLPPGVYRIDVQLQGSSLTAPTADWTLATIITLQSGIPVAMTQSTNANAFAGSRCSSSRGAT